MLQNDFTAFFNRDRISWTRKAPEIWGTRVGYLDVLPGPLLRYWIVFDHEPSVDGAPGTSDLKGFLIAPVETSLIGRAYVGARLEQLGFAVPTLAAAQSVRPVGVRLM